MLKIKILKSGKCAIHPAWGGIIEFTEGDQFKEGDELVDHEGKKTNANNELNVLNREVIRHLEDAGWAKLTAEEPLPDDEDLEKGPMSDLIDLLESVETDKEKKSKIQDWAVVHYGIKPSKSKTSENMIKEIEDHIADNEPDPE